MTVVLADGHYLLGRRPHPARRDSHGTPVPDKPVPSGEFPGAAQRNADGTWTLRLAPESWPIEPGDQITAFPAGRSWTVTSTRLHRVPGIPDVDYVSILCVSDEPDVDRGYGT